MYCKKTIMIFDLFFPPPHSFRNPKSVMLPKNTELSKERKILKVMNGKILWKYCYCFAEKVPFFFWYIFYCFCFVFSHTAMQGNGKRKHFLRSKKSPKAHVKQKSLCKNWDLLRRLNLHILMSLFLFMGEITPILLKTNMLSVALRLWKRDPRNHSV